MLTPISQLMNRNIHSTAIRHNTQTHELKANFVPFLVPMPFFCFASYYITLSQFTYSSHVFTLLLLEAEGSFFLCLPVPEFGSPPSFHINLLLLLQMLLQAILIHTVLYSRMQYLRCICYYFLCHALHTSTASQTEAFFFFCRKCQHCRAGDGSRGSMIRGSLSNPQFLFCGVWSLI